MAATEGYALVGVEAHPVRVEAHVRSGLPGMTIVGLPSAAVREASERIRSGAASSAAPLPAQRITVNLPPADLRKDGSGFDLPIALAVLAASGYAPAPSLTKIGSLGEVGLDGVVRPVRGVLAAAEAARRREVSQFFVPLANLLEAGQVEGIPAVGVCSLAEALRALRDPAYRERLQERGRRWLRRGRPCPPPGGRRSPDLADVAGHARAKRALEIVAAGGHHVLLFGSPGAGKTMIARRLPSLLPPLEQAEALEVTRIWSVSGAAGPLAGLLTLRPFRAPHHTVSRAALIGGGPSPRPGEVSLAHHGVLFLDEFPEFSRDALEGLRQPLEDATVTISRRGGSCTFPAKVTLVAAMNPCPCGYWEHPVKSCTCTASRIRAYQDRVSGPLLDRVDLRLEMPPLEVAALDEAPLSEESERVRTRVTEAKAFQRERQNVMMKARASSGHPASLEDSCALTPAARRLLRETLARGFLGGRGYTRTLGVARTIADLAHELEVGELQVAEALSFRLAR